MLLPPGMEIIQQNDFKRQWQAVGPAVLGAVERVGASGRYILGSEIERFEKVLARKWNAQYAVGVGNGMDALEIGLRCLHLQPGEKVLTTTLSAFATTLAIIRAGGIPVFADVDALGQINLQQCRDLLQKDRSIRYFVPVHLYGFALDMHELGSLKEEFDLRVVEDCAQAMGACDRGLPVGTAGEIAATSFYPTKNLGAMGDGGALLTDDPEIAGQARRLRNYGQSAHYVHSEVGLNSRLDEVHAAILCDAFLPSVEGWTATRSRTAQRYTQEIHHPFIDLPKPSPEMNPVWHLFPVRISAGRRDRFLEHLRVRGILGGVHYPRIIPDQAALRTSSHHIAFDPVNARRWAECEISLPIHPFLAEDEISAVIEACNGWEA